MVAHNGEINTLRGNVNLMRAREGLMSSGVYGSELRKLYPVVEEGLSDSGSLDCVLEFLVKAGGRSLPEAAITMVPEAWQKDQRMNVEKKAFYNWAAMAMEPWDGPALLTFSDGRYVGAVLDRNGLRPARYYQSTDGVLYMSSEVGVTDLTPEQVQHKGRLKPGRMLLVDMEKKVFVRDEELKLQLARQRPVRKWLRQQVIHLEQLHKDYHMNQGFCSYEGLISHEMQSLGIDAEDQLQADRRLSLFHYTHGHFRHDHLAHGARQEGGTRLHGQRRRPRLSVRVPAPALQLLPATLRSGHSSTLIWASLIPFFTLIHNDSFLRYPILRSTHSVSKPS